MPHDTTVRCFLVKITRNDDLYMCVNIETEDGLDREMHAALILLIYYIERFKFILFRILPRTRGTGHFARIILIVYNYTYLTYMSPRSIEIVRYIHDFV